MKCTDPKTDQTKKKSVTVGEALASLTENSQETLLSLLADEDWTHVVEALRHLQRNPYDGASGVLPSELLPPPF